EVDDLDEILQVPQQLLLLREAVPARLTLLPPGSLQGAQDVGQIHSALLGVGPGLGESLCCRLGRLGVEPDDFAAGVAGHAMRSSLRASGVEHLAEWTGRLRAGARGRTAV